MLFDTPVVIMLGGGTRVVREADLQDILDSTVHNIFGSDWFARDSARRLGSLRGSIGSYSSDERLAEEMILDTVRRYSPTSCLSLTLEHSYKYCLGYLGFGFRSNADCEI